MSTSSFAALGTDDLAQLTGAAVAGITSAQVTTLDNEEIQALGTDIANMGSAAFAALTSAQVDAFTSAQVLALESEDVAALTTYGFTGLSTADFGTLTGAAVAGINSDQVGTMNSAEVNALSIDINKLSASAMGALTSAQTAGLSAEQLFFLGSSNVDALSAAVISSLTGAQVAVLSNSGFSGLSTADLASFSSSAAAGITSVHVPNLGSDEIAALGTNIANMQPTAFGALTSAQVDAMDSAQIAALGSEDVAGLSTAGFTGLSTADLGTLTSVAVAGINSAQIATLDSDEIAALGTDIANLKASAMASLSSDQLAAFSNAQVAAFGSEDYNALSISVVNTPQEASLLSSVTGVKPSSEVNEISELTALANAANSVMTVSEMTSTATLTPQAAQTFLTELTLLGVEGLNLNNIYAVWDAIRDTNSITDVNTLTKLQTLADNANNAPLLADMALSLPAILKDSGAAPVTDTAGISVNTLVGGIIDNDYLSIKGIAITGFNTTHGKLFISTDGGVTWAEQTNVSSTSAVGLYADIENSSRVYFLPNTGYAGTMTDAITFRAWDGSGGQVAGTRLDTTLTGNHTAFSEATDTVGFHVVAPITIHTVSTDNAVNPTETLVVSGTADANATVTLTANGKTFSTTADANGDWTYDGSKVRYIMVRKNLLNISPFAPVMNLDNNGIFTIGDIKAYDSNGNAMNLTLAVVTQSAAGGGGDGSVTDGSGSGTSYKEYLGYSTGGGDSWVQVDLGAEYSLSAIDVMSRTNTSGGLFATRLNGAVIYTSNQSMSSMTTAQLNAAINVNGVVINGLADETSVNTYKLMAPVSTNALGIAAGPITVTASESVSGVTNSANKGLITTTSWSWSNTFDGTDPLAGAVWASTTSGSANAATTVNNIVNADAADNDNEFQLFANNASGEQSKLRYSNMALGQDQRLTQLHMAFDLDISSDPQSFIFGMSQQSVANRLFNVQFVTAAGSSDTVISVNTNPGTPETLASFTVTGGLAARQGVDHVSFDVTESGAFTLTLKNGVDADITLTGTYANWLLASMTGLTPEFYANSGTNTAAGGWVDNVQVNATVATSVALPTVSGISVWDNTQSEIQVLNGLGNADTTPFLKGTASLGATVKVYEGTKLLGTTIADYSTGEWTLETAPLTNGQHTLTVRAVDDAGNVGEPASVSVLVNSTTSTWNYTNGFDNAADPLAGGTWNTSNNTATNSTAILNADTSDTDNEFRVLNSAVKPFLMLSDVMAIGANQRMEAFTAAFDMDIGNMALSDTGNRFELRYGTGVNNGFSVKFSEGAISVYWNNGNTPLATLSTALTDRGPDHVDISIDSTGIITVQLTGVGTGVGNTPLTLTGTIPNSEWVTQSMTDYKFFVYGDTGNTASSSGWIDDLAITSTVKSTKLLPTAIIDKVVDNFGTTQGAHTNGATTDDTTPILSGTATGAKTVKIFDGDFYLGTAMVHASTGVWTFPIPTSKALAAGLHTLNVRAIDASGNMGEPVNFQLGVGTTTVTLTSTQVAALITEEFSAFTTADLQALTSAAVPGITSEQVGTLDSAEVQALGTDIANMGASAMGALNSAQLGAMTTDQIATLGSEDTGALNSAALAGLNSAQVAALVTDAFSALTTDDLDALTSAAVAGVTSAQIETLSSSDVQALGTDIANLSAVAFGVFTSSQVEALSTDQIAALSSEDVAAFTTAGISGLTSEQVAALITDAFSALSTADLDALTSAAVPGITSDQVGTLDTAEIQALGTDIANLGADAFGQLNSEQVEALSTDQIAALSSDDVAALSTAGISGLTSEQVAALSTAAFSGLSTDDLQALTSAAVVGITSAQIGTMDSAEVQALGTDIANMGTSAMGALNSSQVDALTSAQVEALGSEDVAALSTNGFSGLSTADLTALTSAQVAGITSAQVGTLTSDEIQALGTDIANMGGSAMGALNSEQVEALSTDQIAALSSEDVAALSTAGISGLTSEQVAALSTAAFSGLSTDDLQALTSAAVVGINSAQIGTLDSAEVQALGTDIANMGTSAMGALNSSQVDVLTSAQVEALGSEDVAALSTNGFSGLSTPDLTALTSAQVAGITSAQVGTLTSDEIQALGTDIANMGADAFGQLNSAQVEALSTDQIAALSSEDVAALSTAGISGLTSEHVAALSTAAFSGLSTDDLQALTSAAVVGITSAQIGTMDSAEVQALGTDIANMGTSAMGALNSSQVDVLTSAQVEALGSEDVAALSTNGFSGLSTPDLTALTSAQVAGITTAQVDTLTSDEIQALGTDIANLGGSAMGALNSEQVEALSTDQIAALSSEDVAALSTAGISGLTSEQVAALSTDALSALSTADLQALTSAAVPGITSAQIGTMDSAEVQALGTDIANMGTSAMGALNSLQVDVLTSAQVEALGSEDVAALSANGFSGLSTADLTALTSAQVAGITTAQVDTLTSDEIQALGTDIANLSGNAFAALTSAQVAALTTAQIEAMGSEDVAALTSAAVVGFGSEQFAVMSTSSFAALGTDDLGQLTSAAVAGITTGQIGTLTSAEVTALGTDIANLSPAAMASLGSDQIAGFTNTQVAAFGSEDYAALGISSVDTPAEVSLLSTVTTLKAPSAVNEVTELTALASAANSVMTVSALGNSETVTPIDAESFMAQLALLGVTGVTGVTGLSTQNMIGVWNAISHTTDPSEVSTLAQIQTLVTNANKAPVGVNEMVSATEASGAANATPGVNPSGNVLSNDTDPNNATNTLVVQDIKAGAGTVHAVTNGTTSADGYSLAGSYGTLVIGADGSYTYTVNQANTAVQALNTGSTALNDVFTYTVKDPGGLISTATLTVAVNGANDQPTVPTSVISNASQEDQGAPTNATFGQTIASLGNITGMNLDPEGAAVGLAFVAPINSASNGTAWYSTDGGTTWLDLSAALTSASTSNALVLSSSARIYFQGNQNLSGNLGTVTVRTWDGTDGTSSGSYKDISTPATANGAYSAGTGTLYLGVTGINDAPVNTVPGAQTVSLDTAHVINGLSFVDVDASSLTNSSTSLTVTLAVGHGTLNIASYNGVTISNNATNSVTLTGNKANLNALLASANAVTYTPDSGYTGGDTLTMTTNDNDSGNDSGNTDIGDALSDQDTVAITVVGVVDNDPPTLLSSTPGDNAFVAPGASLTLNFSEIVSQGTGSIVLYDAAGTPVETFDVTTSTSVTGWGSSTLTIDPSVDLTPGAGYYLQVSSTAVKDSANNPYAGIADATTLNFKAANSDGSIPLGAGNTMQSLATMAAGNTVSSAGDMNNDGYDDFIIGSGVNTAAFVIYGNASGTTPNLPTGTLAAGEGFKIRDSTGTVTNIGRSVAKLGDVNGDGYDDVAVLAEDPGAGTTSHALVVYGSAVGSEVNFSSGTIAASLGFKITNIAGSDWGPDIYGVGDTNGDGFDDFVYGDKNANVAHVVFGKASNTSTTVAAFSSSTQGFKITGADTFASRVRGGGDINGDGLSDLIVDSSGAKSVFVVYGSAATPTNLNLASGTIAGSQGFKIQLNNGSQEGWAQGIIGDVNGDGYADMGFVEQRGNTSTVHDLFVVYGGSNLGSTALNLISRTIAADKGLKFNLDNFYDDVSSAGDVNGDGFSDFMVSDSGTQKVIVVYGGSTLSSVNLAGGTIAAGKGFVVKGEATADTTWFAKKIASVGDFNGDGLSDIVISNKAKYYTLMGGTQSLVSAVNLGGTIADEVVLGTSGDDVLTGGGGVDRFMAGAGDDTIVLTASDVTNLVNNTTPGQTVRATLSGGNGFDTLQLSGGASLDLTNINNLQLDATSDNAVDGIERIDMSTDTAANTLTLNASDVNAMADFNLIHTDTPSADGNTWTNVTGTALAATTKFHQLVVDGTSTDSVVLKTSAGTWTNAGTVNNGTSDYAVWQNTTIRSQVFVKSGVTVTANVAPVVLDLNGDGALSYGNVAMDVNGDGHLDNTAWAAAQDGVLVWDKSGDGKVHDNSQYAFSQYGATGSTDLQGLAAGFDTTQDGVFDAQDAKFAEFKVWQDANQNGVSDAGEVRSLADVGITAIDLVSDGVVRTPAAGVTEAGRTTATAADGTSVLVADAAFDYSALAYNVNGDKLSLLGADMNLDLSSFVAQHGAIHNVELTGTGSNTLKINLSDVVQDASAGSLLVTGDANDAVVLNQAEWTRTGTVQGEGANSGHSYASYNAVNGSAMLLIDEQLMQHQV